LVFDCGWIWITQLAAWRRGRRTHAGFP
jgi:hypothetical protein